MNRRYKVFIWISLNVLGIKDGEKLSVIARLIRFLLMPLDTFYWLLHERMKKKGRDGGIGYDPGCDLFTIYGRKYTGHLFRNWATGGWPNGTLFRFETGEDGTFTLRRLGNEITK